MHHNPLWFWSWVWNHFFKSGLQLYFIFTNRENALQVMIDFQEQACVYITVTAFFISWHWTFTISQELGWISFSQIACCFRDYTSVNSYSLHVLELPSIASFTWQSMAFISVDKNAHNGPFSHLWFWHSVTSSGGILNIRSLICIEFILVSYLKKYSHFSKENIREDHGLEKSRGTKAVETIIFHDLHKQ